MKYIISLLFIAIGFTSYIFACHESTLTEVSVTDNGDGTFDYELEVCIGSPEETYGFEITFNGANLLTANTDCITNPENGETICATIPSQSGDGDVEYGDFDNSSGGDPWQESTHAQQCYILSFTLDGPAADAELFGTEESVGFCGDEEDLTSCFGLLDVDAIAVDATDPCANDGEITAQAFDGFEPYTYSWDNGETGATISDLGVGDYTVTVTDDQDCTTSETFSISAPTDPDYIIELTTPNCTGGNVTWEIEDPDGAIIGSGSLAQNGLTETFVACGCGAQLNLSVPEGTTGPGGSRCSSDMDPDGQIEVFDSDGSSLGSATADGASIELDCIFLPVELKSSKVTYLEDKNLNKVKWKTATETDNNYFTIEHSIDGENWRIIDEISGAGNATSQRSYEIYHTSFVRDEINYYKISQTDFDGTNEEISFLSVDNRYDKKLIKTINIMGQEVNENYSGIVIKYYDDGSTVKSYR